MYALEGDKMLVSEFMHKKEKKSKTLETLILDKTFKYDLENFIKRYYPDFSQEQVRGAGKTFCGKYAGYKKTYGTTFTEMAMTHIFF
jgi:hypothetical protein